MPTNKNIEHLVINKVESKDIYDYMLNNNLINDDELYLVQGEDGKIEIDSALSDTSTNPIQNKVITEVLKNKSDISHNHDSAYDTKGSANTALDSAKSYTNTAVSGLASTSEVHNSISTHNTSTDTHNDIRNLITGLTTRLDTLANNVWYGTCATAAATAAKVVTTTTGNFTLKAGATVYVLFNTAHTSTSRITLNVDGTGDTAVNLSSTNGMTAYQIAAKQVICFVYDGESFRVQGGSLATTQYYGLTKLSSSTSSTSTTMAATPSAVKEAYDLAAAAVSSSDIIDVAHGGTGRSTIVDTEYTTAKYRASSLVSAETNPTDNGVICWVYE